MGIIFSRIGIDPSMWTAQFFLRSLFEGKKYVGVVFQNPTLILGVQTYAVLASVLKYFRIL